MSEPKNEQNVKILNDSFEGNESEVKTDVILNEQDVGNTVEAAAASTDANSISLDSTHDEYSDINPSLESGREAGGSEVNAEQEPAEAAVNSEAAATDEEPQTMEADANPEAPATDEEPQTMEADANPEAAPADEGPGNAEKAANSETEADLETENVDAGTESESANAGAAPETAALAEATGAEPAAETANTEENAADNTLSEDEKKKKRKKILAICGGIVAAIAAIYLIIAFTYKSKFTTGTVINGIDASNMTLEQYEEALTEKVESYVLTMKFRDNKTEKIVGSDVGYTFVSDDGAAKILANQNILAWARGYFGYTAENTVNEGCSFDEEKFTEMVKALPELQFENMEVPRNAHLGVSGDTPEGEQAVFEIVPETYGSQIIPDTFVEAVIGAAKEGVQEYDVDEAGLYVEPDIYSDDPYLKDAIGGFNEFLSASITYDLPNGEKEVLDASVLKNWIAMREDGIQYLNEDIVKEHVDAYVALLAMKVDDVHHDRVLHSTLQGDVSFSSETWGHMIDQEAESAALFADIQNHSVTEREPAYSLNSTYAENFGYTYLEVDIENQTCFYYEDGELCWSSECVTGTEGDSSRRTVRGIFSILNKQKGRTLRGDMREDGTYSYESYVNYWMQFYEGYGLHDATWRSSYEFGGDTYWYAGSHGCVNLPYYAAESLYYMISKGTYVLVF